MKFFSATSLSLVAASAFAAPSDDFDMSIWKLTLPVSEEVWLGSEVSTNPNAAEVVPAQCENTGYTGLGIDEGFEDPDYFYSSDDGAIVFRTPLEDGATTPNTEYVRTELRELYAGRCNVTESNWAPEGVHSLHSTLQVVEVQPSDPELALGKILAKYATYPLVRIQYDGPEQSVRAVMYEHPIEGGAHSLTFGLIPQYDLWSYSLTFADDTLTMSVTHDGETEEASLVMGADNNGRTMSDSWLDYNFYFRAGVFPLADKDDGGAFEAHFYELDVEHSTDPDASL